MYSKIISTESQPRYVYANDIWFTDTPAYYLYNLLGPCISVLLYGRNNKGGIYIAENHIPNVRAKAYIKENDKDLAIEKFFIKHTGKDIRNNMVYSLDKMFSVFEIKGISFEQVQCIGVFCGYGTTDSGKKIAEDNISITLEYLEMLGKNPLIVRDKRSLVYRTFIWPEVKDLIWVHKYIIPGKLIKDISGSSSALPTSGEESEDFFVRYNESTGKIYEVKNFS